MHGGDGHNPLEAILGAMQGMGMKPSDLDQMTALLDPILGKGKGAPTPAQVDTLRFLGMDMKQLPNITLGQFGCHTIDEHRGFGDPVHSHEIVKWTERDEPIFINGMSPTGFNWVYPCHSEQESRRQERALEIWGEGTFKVLTQDEIDAWWVDYKLAEGWHDLETKSVWPDSKHYYRDLCMGRVYVNDEGVPEKVEWIKDGARHVFKDAVTVASAMTGYDIVCNTRYDDKKKTTKLVKSVTRRDAPLQHPNGKPE